MTEFNLSQAEIDLLIDDEDTLYQLSKKFSIDAKGLAFIVKSLQISPMRVEPSKFGRGYRSVYSAKEIIDSAKNKSLLATKSINEIARLGNEVKELNDHQKELDSLRRNISFLKSEEKSQYLILEEVNKKLTVATKQLSQTINDPLLNEDEILLLAGIRRKRVGVYFLIKNETVVYVGQSTNIFQRVGDHESKKDFDTFTYIECAKEDLNIMETKYIVKFKPPLNFNSLGQLVLPMSFSKYETAALATQ
jgi:hypothetical protein